MPSLKHIVKTPYNKTFRSATVEGMFDLQANDILEKSWDVEIPVEVDGDWNIGVIVGPSGSGKTSIGKVLFGEDAYHGGYEDFPYDKCVLDGFNNNLDVKEIVVALNSVGFSSPPNWLQPFHTLSNGQKFRVEMARVMLEDKKITVVDEYTSVVDRNVAKVGSVAIAKYIRRQKKKIVLLSCHYDILEWLEPDWVYHVDTSIFEDVGRCERQYKRPEIKFEIKRCHYSTWRIFKEHHYLNTEINKASKCWVGLVNGEPAAFYSVVHSPNRIKNIKRGHRLVVLPDYQGLGLGSRLRDAVADYYASKGFLFLSVTSHPALIASCGRSKHWRLTDDIKHRGGKTREEKEKGMDGEGSSGRLTSSFQYIGYMEKENGEG